MPNRVALVVKINPRKTSELKPDLTYCSFYMSHGLVFFTTLIYRFSLIVRLVHRRRGVGKI